eukprot:TRINITY_DN48460_c0_g1_i1.p2 TRINITY_DN48460_c0_g1~~TRINITY_DN48460_c0_g1_i1.p2  ORF type:complete len:104 (-),score=9.70 TRINITY_DN48460_c0_g1_i1:355-666(-)
MVLRLTANRRRYPMRASRKHASVEQLSQKILPALIAWHPPVAAELKVQDGVRMGGGIVPAVGRDGGHCAKSTQNLTLRLITYFQSGVCQETKHSVCAFQPKAP